MLNKKDTGRLQGVKKRVADLYRTSSRDIRENRIRPIGMAVISDLRFLVAVVEALYARQKVDISTVKLPQDGADNDFLEGYDLPMEENLETEAAG